MAQVHIVLPAQLSRFVDNGVIPPFEATNVDAVVQKLRETAPTLADQVLGEDGRLRRFLKMYVDGRDSRYLSSSDRFESYRVDVTFLMAFSGG